MISLIKRKGSHDLRSWIKRSALGVLRKEKVDVYIVSERMRGKNCVFLCSLAKNSRGKIRAGVPCEVRGYCAETRC